MTEVLERAAGIEPASLAWKAKVLPLHNARFASSTGISWAFERQARSLFASRVCMHGPDQIAIQGRPQVVVRNLDARVCGPSAGGFAAPETTETTANVRPTEGLEKKDRAVFCARRLRKDHWRVLPFSNFALS